MDVKWVTRTGVTAWEISPSHLRYLPRRTLRHLGVSREAEPLCLLHEIEPFFQDTADAAGRLREVLREFGPAEACIHSTWLNRPEKCGAGAEKWLDQVGGNHWWYKDVSWRFRDSDLRVLAVSDTDSEMTSMYAWGRDARAVFDDMAAAWELLPKSAPSAE